MLEPLQKVVAILRPGFGKCEWEDETRDLREYWEHTGDALCETEGVSKYQIQVNLNLLLPQAHVNSD